MLGISRLLIYNEKTVKPQVNYCFFLRFQHYRVFVADISYLSNKLYRKYSCILLFVLYIFKLKDPLIFFF